MTSKKRKNILVVSHDAGGAQIISAYVKKFNNTYNFKCLVLGPALPIFKKKGIKNLLDKNMASKLIKNKAVNLVLTGTSWGSPIELEMIQSAKRESIPSTAYLDHWVNYRERFGYPSKNWKNNLPDELWVGDKYAFTLAKKFFSIPVKRVPNFYFQEIKEKYKSIKKRIKPEKGKILFMDEPMSKSLGKKNNFDEFSTLKALLDYFSQRRLKNSLVICYHPSSQQDKYNKLLLRYPKVKIEKQGKEILKDLAQSFLVIGMTSMILAVAAICKKKVISFIPNKSVMCPLPFLEIIKIRSTKELDKIVT